MQQRLTLVAVLLLSASGCVTSTYWERLSESLDDLDYAGVAASYEEADVRIIFVRYRHWRGGNEQILGYRVPPDKEGRLLTQEEALKRVPLKIPPPHATARWVAGAIVVPFTALTDLALLPLFPVNVWIGFRLGFLRLF